MRLTWGKKERRKEGKKERRKTTSVHKHTAPEGEGKGRNEPRCGRECV